MIGLLFNNLQPIGVGARGGGPWGVAVRRLYVGVPRHEVLTRRSLGFGPAMVRGRTSCLLAEALGGRANVSMSLLAQDRTEEFDPDSD